MEIIKQLMEIERKLLIKELRDRMYLLNVFALTFCAYSLCSDDNYHCILGIDIVVVLYFSLLLGLISFVNLHCGGRG